MGPVGQAAAVAQQSMLHRGRGRGVYPVKTETPCLYLTIIIPKLFCTGLEASARRADGHNGFGAADVRGV